MIALLLAAGFGTRLKPLTDTLPKPLIPVGGLPLIVYNLALLKHHGIREVVINLHHLGHLIRKALGNGRPMGMKIHYSNEPHILGTGGGIRKAARQLGKDILVINSDIISDINLGALIRQHQRDKNLATLVLREHPEAAGFGLLHFRGRRLLSILKNPEPPAGALSAHFTGIHIVRRDAILRLPLGKPRCIIRDLYMPALLSGEKLGVKIHRGFWTDCGTHKAIARAEADLGCRPVPLQHRSTVARFYKKLTHS